MAGNLISCSSIHPVVLVHTVISLHWSFLMLYGNRPAILHLCVMVILIILQAEATYLLLSNSPLMAFLVLLGDRGTDDFIDTILCCLSLKPCLKYSLCLIRFVTLICANCSFLNWTWRLFTIALKRMTLILFADGHGVPSISLHRWVCRDSTLNFLVAHPMVLKSIMWVNWVL